MDFTINGENWHILFVKPTNPILQTSQGDYTVGVTDRNEQIIAISDFLQGQFLKKVLCHEICHANIFSQGIEMSETEEERLCDYVATYGNDIVNLTNHIFETIKEKTA